MQFVFNVTIFIFVILVDTFSYFTLTRKELFPKGNILKKLLSLKGNYFSALFDALFLLTQFAHPLDKEITLVRKKLVKLSQSIKAGHTCSSGPIAALRR